MKTRFESSFFKSLDKLTDTRLKLRIGDVIIETEGANKLTDIKHLKKMKGYKSYYRIKLGDYRIGFEFIAPDTVNFILVSHRKDIYRNFP